MNDNPNGQASTPRDDVGELLALARRELELPPEREARLRGALRAPWLATVRSRRRARLRRFTLAALAAAALLTIVVAVRERPPSGAAPAATVAEAVKTLGTLTLRRPGPGGPTAHPLLVGAPLSVGDMLSSGNDGLAALTLAGGASLRLDAGSSVLLASRDEVELQEGAVYVDSGGPGSASAPLVVRTPYGTVAHVGTQFEVRLAASSLSVRVREGEVLMSHGGASHRLRGGEEVVLDARGEAARRAISGFGPAWEWVLRVAPLEVLDGGSLRSFLDAYAREAGVAIRFTDAGLVGLAEDVRVHGLPWSAAPDDLLESALAASGLRASQQDGVLTISGEHE